MGMPETAETETRGNAMSVFDRVIAMKLKKRIEDTMVSIINDFEFDDDCGDMLNEIINEIMGDPKLKARIKTKVLETLDEDKLVDKVSTRIISQLLKG